MRLCGKEKVGNEYLTEKLKSIRNRSIGTWPSLVRVPEWGSGGRRFESGRPDHRNIVKIGS